MSMFEDFDSEELEGLYFPEIKVNHVTKEDKLPSIRYHNDRY